MYHRVFQILFSSLGFGLQKPMWKHIHGDGFEGVTADMCAKQAEGKCNLYIKFYIKLTFVGLGKYLHDIDPSRSWRDHIQYILVFCLVHYNRNVQPFRRHPEFRTMRELPFMSSKQQALEYLAKWKLDPLIGGWAKHKSCSWVSTRTILYKLLYKFWGLTPGRFSAVLIQLSPRWYRMSSARYSGIPIPESLVMPMSIELVFTGPFWGVFSGTLQLEILYKIQTYQI